MTKRDLLLQIEAFEKRIKVLEDIVDVSEFAQLKRKFASLARSALKEKRGGLMTNWYEDPVYIKMCDCKEIQDIIIKRVISDNGWLRTSAVGLTVNAIAKNGEVFTLHFDTWLPTQSQLQGMVELSDKEHRGRVLALCEMFNGYCATHTIGEFTSMEQLWLAFVQKQKWNKVWDGEKWVKC